MSSRKSTSTQPGSSALFELDRQLLTFLSPDNFFSPFDWVRHYGAELSENIALPDDLEKLREIVESPCPFVKNKAVKETHYFFYLPSLFNDQPLNILKWQEIYPKSEKRHFSDYQQGDVFDFAKDVSRHRWFLMFTGIIPNSTSKSLAEQLELKPAHYNVPKIVECASMHFFVLEKSGLRLNDGIYGRTSDHDDDGDSVASGNFDHYGFSVYDRYYLDSDREPELGLFLYRQL